MSDISFIGLFIAVLLMVFFILQGGLLIRAINKKEKRKFILYLIGVIATLLLTIFMFCQSLGIDLSSNFLIIGALIMATLFYIGYGFNSLFVTTK
jgi:hypothetical protein